MKKDNENKSYVFVIPSGLPQGIIESQIINMATSLYGRNRLIFHVNGSSAKKVTKYLCEKYPEHIFQNNITFLYKNVFNIKFIYFRSVVAYAKYFALLKLLRLHKYCKMDFRALVSEESHLRNQSPLRKYILSKLEMFAYRTAPSVGCISNNLREYLISRYGNRAVSVIPCCITASDVIRKTKFNGAKNKLRLIYVGGMSQWQNFRTICGLVKALSEHKNCEFSVITHDKKLANKICVEAGISDYKLASGDRKFVFDALDKSDFGFIFRDDSIINKTASPIKFLEYLARGVIPITHGSIGDYTDDKNICDNIIQFQGSVEKLLSDIDMIFDDISIFDQVSKIAKQYTWINYKTNNVNI